MYLEGDRDVAFQTTADGIASALGVDLAELHALRRRRAKNKTGISKLKAQLASLEADAEEAQKRAKMSPEEKLKARVGEYRDLLVAKNREVVEARQELTAAEAENYALSVELEEERSERERLEGENEELRVGGAAEKHQLLKEMRELRSQIDALNRIFIV